MMLPLLLLLLVVQLMSLTDGSSFELSDDEAHLLSDQLATELVSGEDYGGLVWHDLKVTTTGHHTTTLVQSTSGILHNGQLTGLLGPSGSGKTTLMSALAGLCPLHVRGVVGSFHQHASGVQVRNLATKQVAWLQQQDDFFTQLTVQETLELAAFLELPDVSQRDRKELVRQTCSQLGLQHALHRPIGDPSEASAGTFSIVPSWLHKRKMSKKQRRTGGRLSGGERRRLSVALELLTQKQMLIAADEPTTGLDTAYSVVVMKLLKDLSVSRNIPAICSLHQPRSSIWTSLDSVILMAPGGRVCYAGNREATVAYFEKLGHKLPANTNPAEFLVDLVSIDSENPVDAARDEARIEHLAAAFAKHQERQWKSGAARKHQTVTVISVGNETTNTSQTRHSKKAARKSLIRWIPRLAALWKRSWRQNTRDFNLNFFRLIASVGNAMLLAGIFPTVRGPVPLVNSIADRVALLSFGAINLCMLAYMKAVTLFAQERPIIRREQTREQYSVAEYLIAKVLAEMPLDSIFSVVFTTILKQQSGLNIGWTQLTSVFSLLTMAGASLGFLIGSLAPSDQYAASAGIPVLVILMVVGIINPSGVDPNAAKPLILEYLKKVSPFTFAIEALCLGEYPGIKFEQQSGGGYFSRLKNAPRMGGLAMVKGSTRV